jgi:hypothetical protein
MARRPETRARGRALCDSATRARARVRVRASRCAPSHPPVRLRVQVHLDGFVAVRRGLVYHRGRMQSGVTAVLLEQ